MLIQSKVTTLQISKNSSLLGEKSQTGLNNSKHFLSDTIPIIVSLTATEPLKINKIDLNLKLIHPVSRLVIIKFETLDFIFSVIQQETIEAILYLPCSQLSTYYGWRGLDFSERRHEILYELSVVIPLEVFIRLGQQKVTKVIETGVFYVS